MFWFTVKKAFFDFWDNMAALLLFNFSYLLCFGLLIFIPFFGGNNLIFYLLWLLVCLIMFFLTGTLYAFTKDIADYRSPGIGDLPSALLKSIKPSLFIFALFAFILIVNYSAFQYYVLVMQGFFGYMFFITLISFSIILLVALQYFFPIYFRIDQKIIKTLRYCLVLFFSNTFFSLASFIWGLLIGTLSLFTLGLVPGFSALIVWFNTATKLRLYKHYYQQENPEERIVPWDKLLKEDNKNIGPRSLKGMFFPWKD